MQVIEGGINAAGKKFAIIVSRFNHFMVESLLDGAVQTLKHYGEVADDDITVVRVLVNTTQLLRSVRLFAVAHHTSSLLPVNVIVV